MKNTFLNKIDSIIKVKLPITKIGGPVRTKIFKDVLRIFYETQTETINNLLELFVEPAVFFVSVYEELIFNLRALAVELLSVMETFVPAVSSIDFADASSGLYVTVLPAPVIVSDWKDTTEYCSKAAADFSPAVLHI